MQLKMWGTRGSLPRTIDNQTFIDLMDTYVQEADQSGIKSMTEFREYIHNRPSNSPFVYGGNTSCNEIIHEDRSFFVDMGTGIVDACHDKMKLGITEYDIFQTHMHWDHIMGLPFFVPIYIPGNRITIYHVHANTPRFVKLLFNGVNFPVKWEDLRATIEFRRIRLYSDVNFGDLKVSSFSLDHPGGSFGYRFDADDQSIAIGVDGEYKRLTPKELGKDLPYYQNLDLLVFDAQYAMDELVSRFDWGHCSAPIGIDLALREGIRNIILTHHDPRSNEVKENRMLAQAEHHLKRQLPAYIDVWNRLGQPKGPNVQMAYDGLLFDLNAGQE